MPEGDDSRVRHWPDLLFWYPGLSHRELETMSAAMRQAYEKALPRLKAERLSMMVDASAFTKMKEDSQKRLIRRIEKDMASSKPKDQPKASAPPKPDDLASLGIGMVFVDAEGAPVEVENVGGRPHIDGKPVGGQ
jgi:hypothetical protein